MSDEQVARMNVLLEHVDSKVTALVEGHGALAADLSETKDRLGRVEQKVDAVQLKVEGMDHKVDGMSTRLDRIEHHLRLNGGSPKKTRRRPQ